jgi:hypothetical protein
VFEDETPVAWQAVPRHTPVLAADGSEIGTAETLLGDEDEDIFHGVVVRRTGSGETVEIPAHRVKKMTTRRVVTDLAPSEAAALPPYSRR